MPRIKSVTPVKDTTRRRTIAGAGDVREGFNLGNTDAPPEVNTGEELADTMEIVQPHEMADKVAMERFMNEKVVVEVESDPEDENAPVFIYLGHNGINQYVKRGEPQTIKRKFLYAALVAKRVKMACAFGKDGAGNEFNRLSPSASMTYRIHLVSDNNPQGGMKWVQSVMRAAA